MSVRSASSVARRRSVVCPWPLLALLFAAPSTAAAWTETDASGFEAHLELSPEGSAYVSMRIGLQVKRGRLEGYDLSLRDTGIELDTRRPPTLFETQEGQEIKRPVEASIRNRDSGRVRLTMPRGSHPRRGRYSLHLHYHSELASTAELLGEDRVRFQWHMPVWKEELENVRLTALLPSRSRISSPDNETATIHVREHGEVTEATWSYRQLPRRRAVTLTFDVPISTLAPELQAQLLGTTGAAGQEQHEARNLLRAPSWKGTLAIGWAWLVAWLTFKLTAQRAREAGWTASPLLTMPGWMRHLLATALALTAIACWHALPLAALSSLGGCLLLYTKRLHHGGQNLGLGDWRTFSPPGQRGLARASYRLFDLKPQLEPTLVMLGFVVLVLFAPLEAWQLSADPWACALAMTAPLWVARTHAWLPQPQARQRRRLAGAAGNIQGTGMQLSLLHYVTTDGEQLQPRLDIRPSVHISGLKRLQIACDVRPGARHMWLCAIVDGGSAADHWLQKILAPLVKQKDAVLQSSPGGLFCAHSVVYDPRNAHMASDLLSSLREAGQRSIEQASREPRRDNRLQHPLLSLETPGAPHISSDGPATMGKLRLPEQAGGGPNCDGSEPAPEAAIPLQALPLPATPCAPAAMPPKASVSQPWWALPRHGRDDD